MENENSNAKRVLKHDKVDNTNMQLMWELKRDWELSEWLTKPFCTLPGELWGKFTVISMSDPGPV